MNGLNASRGPEGDQQIDDTLGRQKRLFLIPDQTVVCSWWGPQR